MENDRELFEVISRNLTGMSAQKHETFGSWQPLLAHDPKRPFQNKLKAL
jgi:hypothetical protein